MQALNTMNLLEYPSLCPISLGILYIHFQSQKVFNLLIFVMKNFSSNNEIFSFHKFVSFLCFLFFAFFLLFSSFNSCGHIGCRSLFQYSCVCCDMSQSTINFGESSMRYREENIVIFVCMKCSVNIYQVHLVCSISYLQHFPVVSLFL